MADSSVDDMYYECKPKMAENINKYYDKENTGLFKKVWKGAEKCADTKSKNTKNKDPSLTKDHLQAICAYTADKENLYSVFNQHVREDGMKYDTFPFHFLHYWLTTAVQILKSNKRCLKTYRRTNLEFKAEENKEMRFGFFASSSINSSKTHFGTKTCFDIETCSGGDLKDYPVLGIKEEEVLIPPYEVFKITEIRNDFNKHIVDCDVIYILKHSRNLSNFNCKALKV